jgi:hypothetical protein
MSAPRSAKGPSPTNVVELHPRGERYLALNRPVVDARGIIVRIVSPKCRHPNARGQWVVAWGRRYVPFVVDHPMSRQVWLKDAETDAEESEREGLCRWFCGQCWTVQRP